ncbi:MAG: hypothetical protein WC043_00660 [Pseudobdellovibrionaceae bacterium]
MTTPDLKHTADAAFTKPAALENLTIIPSNIGTEQTAREIAHFAGSMPVHCTNGTYANQSLPLRETTLAGFQYVLDQTQDGILVIAVNSDKSMREHVKNVENPASERDRALFVATPLALQYPDKEILVVFYDDATPLPLYTKLEENTAHVASLHKHGNYGTDANGPIIEGAHLFANTFAFPFPSKEKAVCEDLTRTGDQNAIIKVRDLYGENGPHGTPYLSPSKKILFPLTMANMQLAEPISSGFNLPKNDPA